MLTVPVAATGAVHAVSGVVGPRARVALPLAWVAIDGLRAVGPFAFPWGYAGYALVDTPMSPVADLGGIHLASLLVLVTAGLLAAAARRRSPSYALVGLALLGVAFLYGQARLRQPAGGRPLSVSIVQGNIDPSSKALGLSWSLATYVGLTHAPRASWWSGPRPPSPRC